MFSLTYLTRSNWSSLLARGGSFQVVNRSFSRPLGYIYIYIYVYIYTCLIEKNGTLIVYYLFPRVLIFPN